MPSNEVAEDGYPFGYGPKENVLVWAKRNPVGDEAEDCLEAAAAEIERLHKEADEKDSAVKKGLTSDPAYEAWKVAEYRLRKNARYETWTERRRFNYCMAKALDAAMKGQG